jgi:hypothetical protein
MDSKNNFLIKLQPYINSLDEDYLIGVTNKGIFNRALKDLDSGAAVNISIEEECIKCEMPDGNVCSINENIRDFKCSCPSRSICKHTVMSYLYIKQHFDEIFGEASQEEKPEDNKNEIIQDFSELLYINTKSIKNALGDREFGNIAKRMEFGLRAIINEGSILQVEFEGEGILVKFIPAQGSKDKTNIPIKDSVIVTNSICSCKSKELCKHKAEAVIQYGIFKGAIDRDEVISLIKKDKTINKENLENCIKEVMKTIGEIYSTGLARIPEGFVDKLEQTAVICHNNDIPSLEKKLRALQGKLKLYLGKNAAFTVESFRQLLQNVYILTIAMKNCKDEKSLLDLIGEHKTSYYEIPPIELTGVGASSWVTESGYEGTTYYFIAESFNRWFTYTSSRTVGNVIRKNQQESYPWGIISDQKSFCSSKIRLVSGKVNDDFRLSSSDSSKGEIIGSTDISEIYVKDKTFSDWKELFLKLSENSKFGFSEREENDNLFLLKVADFGESSFDGIHQVFNMDIYDIKGQSITIEIKYTPKNKKLIELLENMNRLKSYPFMLLAKVYTGDEKLIVVPITAYYENGKIINLTM